MYNMNDYEIDYVDGSRDSQLLLYQSYLYNKHGKYYMCRNKDCKLLVKLTVRDDEVLVEPRHPKHGHFQVTDCEIACLKAIKKMKNDVSTNRANDDVSVIYNDAITHLTKILHFNLIDINEYIKPYQQFRGTLNKCRDKVKPTNPKTQAELSLSGDYLLTNEHLPFMRYDNNNFDNRIIIFMSNFGVEWARESFMLFGDGTFLHTPALSEQFYVNFSQKHDLVFPITYTILPNRKTETYVEMLSNLLLNL